MTAVACTQTPGCGGTIEDGYCNVCGLAPASPVRPTGRPVALRQPPATRASATRARAPSPGRPAGTQAGRAQAAGGVGQRGFRQRRLGERGHGQRRVRFRRNRQPGRHPRLPVVERPVVTRQARRRPCRGAAGSRARPGGGRARRPAGPGEPAVLRQLRPARRPVARWQPRPNGRVLPELRHPLLLQPQAGARRAGGRAVRGARLPRARRTRLDLPGAGPQRQRPLGGAQGPAQHRGRGRDGRRRRRAAVPRPA